MLFTLATQLWGLSIDLVRKIIKAFLIQTSLAFLLLAMWLILFAIPPNASANFKW